MREGAARWLEGALALGLALLVFAPAVLGDATVFAGDISVFESPRDRLLAEALRAGEGIPRWVPGIAGGVSARASQELGTLYPPTVVLAWLAPERAEALGLVLHVALAALGAAALARTLGLGEGPARLAGLAFGLSGSLVSTHLVPVYVRSAAWLPWAVTGILRGARGDPLGVLLASVVLALGYLAGDPQGTAVAALVGLGLAFAHGGRRELGRASLAVAAAGALAVLLALVQLAPALAAFSSSERSGGIPFEAATRWSLAPRELVGLALPLAFGTHAQPGSLFYAAVSETHERAWCESLYLGPVVLALALAGASRLDRCARARSGLGIALVFLALALGANAPFYAVAFRLPGVALFRYPAKLQVPMVLGLALLAASGLEGLLAGEARARKLATGTLGALAAAAVLGTNLAVQGGLGLADRIDAASLPGLEGERALAFLAPRCAHVALVALGGLALVLGPRRRPRALALALVALVAIDLVLPARSQIALAPREAFARVPEAARALAALSAATGEPARVLPTESGERPTADEAEVPPVARAFVAEQQGLAPNTGLGFGVLSQGGFLSNYPARLARLDAHEPLAPRRRAVLQGARFVLAAGAQARDYASPGLGPAASAGDRVLVRLEEAPPWAAVYRRARAVAGPDAALAAIADPSFDPRREVVLETRAPLASPGDGDPVPARLVGRFGADAFELETAAPAGGWLVLREGWGAGWWARVDGGEPVAAVPADLVFRAVLLPAGARRVRLEYVAPGASLGALGTGVGLVVLAAGLALAIVRRRGTGSSRKC